MGQDVGRRKFTDRGAIDGRMGVYSFGMPLLGNDIPSLRGTVYHVSSSNANASDNNTGKNPDRPLATLQAAINKTTANKGDLIIVAEQHAETIATAGGLAINKAGITIIGLGAGTKRPTFTFATLTSATCTITAANVRIKNIVGTTSVDQLVSAFVISGSDCTLDMEWQDQDATHEALRAILTTAAADRLNISLVYRGFTGGSHGINAIRLVGCDGARIFVDYYGILSAGGVVEFFTTACTNVDVYGRFHVSGTSNFSLNVVDTITGSTWTARGYDGVAGTAFRGGAGAALATDPAISAVTDALYGTNGIATYLAGAAAANNVSISEVIRWIQDVVRNGSGGTVMGANKSVLDAIGYDGVVAIANSAGMLRTAAGSMFEVKKTLTSSAVTQAGVDITLASTGGDVEIVDIVLHTDGTGLAAGTNIQIVNNNAKGATLMTAEAVANLGATKTVNMAGASVTVFRPDVLESGKKLTMKSTVADCTGAGTVDVYLVCRRLADGAALVNA